MQITTILAFITAMGGLEAVNGWLDISLAGKRMHGKKRQT